jgi:type I restriction enzyme S subunit
MSFPRYVEYKDSGVEWLGEVPEHWIVASLKRGFTVKLGKMLQPDNQALDDELKPYLRAANIQLSGVDTSDVKCMWFSQSELQQLGLREGDLLVSEGGDVGRSVIWRSELDECYFQNSINRVQGRGDNLTTYLQYWMSTIKDQGYVDVLCNKSTIAHFTAEKVATVPVPFPPGREQSAIATFLNRETGKIDAMVAEQEILIALIKEKRQAVISHAVTNGLDPTVPMKDSGIEWLGAMPKHWKLCRIKALFRLVKRQENANAPILSVYREYGVIEKSSRDDNFNKTPEDLSLYQTVQPGDLVINKMKAWQGSLGISNFFGITSPDYVVYQARHGEHGKFFHYFLRSARMPAVYQIMSNGIRPDQWRLEPDKFEQLWVPVAPTAEQFAIAAFLDKETAKLDALVTEVQRAIDLLKEHRSALISAAVTGKIDVRQFVKQAQPSAELVPA